MTITNLSKAYDVAPERRRRRSEDGPTKTARKFAVQDVSFDVKAGEMFTLLGPSGCGKTTTLRSIAGLETPNTGTIRVEDRVLYDSDNRVNVQPYDRKLGMVFQSYAIWPHLTVFKNVSFPLEVLSRKTRPNSAEIRRRAHQALEMTELSELTERPATALSGGQQQRLALARGLVINPSLVLLDEPLSNLDAKLRESMRFELKRLQHELGLTCIYVTHDQVEALTLSDRIAVMNEGRIVQVGTPKDIYERPNSRFVADFIGVTNFLEGTVTAQEGRLRKIEVAVGSLWAEAPDAAIGDHALLSLRPESVTVATEPGSQPRLNEWRGSIARRAFQGDAVDHVVRIGEMEIRSRSNPSHSYEENTEVYVSIPPQKVVVVPTEERL
ncbi:ABC transporter ATP-binding protein [Microbacterium sp. SYP-A9085]|uniref:ABC transporter ATP-binding protein n=1 Tax=Microbacterium sp. SYP-A9085 TaxID=2664454 RepID=UPI001C12B156|nr:ABC transporter ATP-binding protein [Microbacterium sp. SYP-A9085]